MKNIDREHLKKLNAIEEKRFLDLHPKSGALFEKAKGVMPGGVPMSWMAKWPGAYPIFVESAAGSHFTDVDGNEYIDFCLGDTGSMTGHSPAATVAAITEQMKHGFTSMLLKLINDFKPEYAVVVLDSKGKNFRHDLFKEYKANRPPAPDDLISQLQIVRKAAEALNFCVLAKDGFEADDILATIAKRAESEGAEVLICTGDRDSFQLVNDRTTVLYPKRGVSDLARMTPEAVLEIL